MAIRLSRFLKPSGRPAERRRPVCCRNAVATGGGVILLRPTIPEPLGLAEAVQQSKTPSVQEEASKPAYLLFKRCEGIQKRRPVRQKDVAPDGGIRGGDPGRIEEAGPDPRRFVCR